MVVRKMMTIVSGMTGKRVVAASLAVVMAASLFTATAAEARHGRNAAAAVGLVAGLAIGAAAAHAHGGYGYGHAHYCRVRTVCRVKYRCYENSWGDEICRKRRVCHEVCR